MVLKGKKKSYSIHFEIKNKAYDLNFKNVFKRILLFF